jgi:hypothetical protein
MTIGYKIEKMRPFKRKVLANDSNAPIGVLKILSKDSDSYIQLLAKINLKNKKGSKI